MSLQSWTTVPYITAEVDELFQQAGILLFFLSLYSPDLNPLEEAFSYVKTYTYTCEMYY